MFILSFKKAPFPLPFPDSLKPTDSNNDNYNFQSFINLILPGINSPALRCQNCGAVKFNSSYEENCCNNIIGIRKHFPTDLHEFIYGVLMQNIHVPNFAKHANLLLRPVVQNSDMRHTGGASNMLTIAGIPYAVDSRKQFINPVNLIFNGLDMKYGLSSLTNLLRIEIEDIIQFCLQNNENLSNYLLTKNTNLGGKDALVAYINEIDQGTNLAIVGAENRGITNTEQVAILNQINEFRQYKTELLDPLVSKSDQLCYPLIYWDGKGGCGRLEGENDWIIKKMKYCCLSLLMQPPSHFIHKLKTLTDEYYASIYGRIMQIMISNGFQRQFLMKKFKEIHNNQANQNDVEEYGTRTVVPSKFVGTAVYWKSVTNHAFILSSVIVPRAA